MTKVFLVGTADCESDMLLAVYANKEKALVAYHENRLELLEQAKHSFEWSKERAKKDLEENKDYEGKPYSDDMITYLKDQAENGDDMYLNMIKNLSEEDPDKMSNYPSDTPYLKEEEVIL